MQGKVESPAALAPTTNTFFGAQGLPHNLFQGGLLGHLPLNHLATQHLNSQVKFPAPYGSQSLGILSSQLQGSICASQSGRQTVAQSGFPSNEERKKKKLWPLPEDFSPTYCILAKKGIPILEEEMKSKLLRAQKSKKFDKGKYSLIFNMKRCLSTCEESTSDSESAKTSSWTQKRKQAYESSYEDNLNAPSKDKLKYSSDSSSEDRVQHPFKKRQIDLDKNGNLAKSLPSQSQAPSETQQTLNEKQVENEEIDQLQTGLHNGSEALTPAKPPQTREEIKSNDDEDKQADLSVFWICMNVNPV
ncbi:hypothetical protein DFH28DRAFT_934402 [Melampsora americana]|nr:hypothetical protein DFH28DRAFT_934402 [Melampsora americana]